MRGEHDFGSFTLAGRKLFFKVDALSSDIQAEPLLRVVTFSAPSVEDDPQGEHDFGSFTLAGRKFFFKVDAYDDAMRCGSGNPADPCKPTRVLTVMLAEEY